MEKTFAMKMVGYKKRLKRSKATESLIGLCSLYAVVYVPMRTEHRGKRSSVGNQSKRAQTAAESKGKNASVEARSFSRLNGFAAIFVKINGSTTDARASSRIEFDMASEIPKVR